MHTARYNPWNTFFNNNHAYYGQHTKNFNPAVEVYDNGEGYTLKADLPGVAKEDIAINVNDGCLILEGERKKPETGDKSYYRSEVAYGTFRRVFKLATEINADGITAEFNNGVLTVNIPKPEEVKPKQIQIN